MSCPYPRTTDSPRRFRIALIAGFLLCAPQVASADTFVLMMDRGAVKKKLVADLGGKLRAAGHKVIVTGGSLEDSALMLGCNAKKTTCLDKVIEAGGAKGAIILPRGKGSIHVRRSGLSKRAKVLGRGTIAAHRSALGKLLVLAPAKEGSEEESVVETPAPAPAPAPAPDPAPGPEVTEASEPAPPPPSGADLSGSSGQLSENGGFELGRVKLRTWAVLGTGVASTVTGLVLFQMAAGKQDKIDNHPIDTAEELRALQDLEASGNRYGRVGTYMVIAGGVTTLAGAGLMVYDSRSARRERRLSVIPTASPSSVGVSLLWKGL